MQTEKDEDEVIPRLTTRQFFQTLIAATVVMVVQVVMVAVHRSIKEEQISANLLFFMLLENLPRGI